MARDLIVFGEDWGGLPSSTQHLVGHLANDRKVVWVNSIGLRRPKIGKRDIGRAWNKLTASNSAESSVDVAKKPANDNFHVVNPRTLPVPRTKVERNLAARILQSQIKPVVKSAGLKNPILWTSLPTAVDMQGKLGDKGLAYYCGDDFSALAGVDHDVVSEREQELAEKSDLIMVASDVLAEKFPAEVTQLMPHGVDYDLFTTPAPRAEDLPNDGRPIAGFYGSLSNWLDIDLLVQVANRMPEWWFVFIGAPAVDVSALQACPNVKLLGPRSHHELPRYSQHWTVSMLPFVDNAQIRACNPLKLREYLAAGRPIVSTPFPAMFAYGDLIQSVDSVGGMVVALQIQAVGIGLNTDAMRAAVADHSWQARAERISNWLESLGS